MCQYSITKRDAVPHAWQMTHLGARAVGGFALVYTEATAVTAQGRISDQDTGIWNDDEAEAWAPIVDSSTRKGRRPGSSWPMPAARPPPTLGCPATPPPGNAEPASAGRRLGNHRPVRHGRAGAGLTDGHDAGTDRRVDFRLGRRGPAGGRRGVRRRADPCGPRLPDPPVLSPLTNTRTDAYGGSFENRTRYAREVIAAVREAWPAHKTLAIRLSGDDWVQGGWRIADTARFALEAFGTGVGAFDLSSAGIGAYHGPSGPGFQVSLAAAVKAAVPGAFVTAVGLITEPAQAEQVLVTGAADGVSIGRAALKNPNWPAIAAAELGEPHENIPFPAQYWRANW